MRCQTTNDSNGGNVLIGRRDILACLNVATVTAAVWSPLLCSESAHAADLTQRIQRGKFLDSIKAKLRIAVKDNADLVPAFLRLALNDAATYDKASSSGGPNGSIRFSSELNRSENKDLAVAVQFLESLKKDIDAESKGGPISWADLVQFAGQSATKRTFLDASIRKCGGDEAKGEFLYGAFGSNGQWGFFDKQFGRSDALEPDLDGKVLLWDKASVPDIKSRFKQLGLTSRQLAVMSMFLGPDQLATEAKLQSDPEIEPWIKKYQRSRETLSQTDYEVDLITAFTKLSTLGQKINYEAYTYAPPPIKFKL